MKEAFKEMEFKPASLERIGLCNEIIATYLSQNLRLTLRQLYYQLVTQNAIANTEREYKNLSTLVSNARLAGLMDWDAIEDRIRQPRVQTEFENLDELVDAALSSYRLPRWRGQKFYTELWVEKDALAGVLQPLARDFHVTLMVNRGYSSQSAMRESAKRFAAAEAEDKSCILFYLGDHDPSGEDMVRDIQARLDMFGCDVKVLKLALTMEQVRQYNPPPNPAKMTDPRAGGYVSEHGNESWEVDALRPDILARIVQTAFRRTIDQKALAEVLAQEDKDKEALGAALEQVRGA